MMWTLAEAAGFVANVERRFRESGWLLCMYGSVLYFGGSHHDLDLMVVPWRPCPNAPDLVLSVFGGVVHSEYRGAMNTRSFICVLPDKRVLDIQFRLGASNAQA